jgi:regulator of sigma E protease
MRIIRHLGDKDLMQVETKNQQGVVQTYQLSLLNWKIDPLNPDPLESLGLVPLQPPVPSIVHAVVAKGPAAKAGILPGDKILSVNNHEIANWFDFIRFIQTHPQTKVTLWIERNHTRMPITAEIGRKLHGWRWIGYLGIEALPVKWPENMKVLRQYSPLPALVAASDQTWSFFAFNFILLGKMLMGKVSLQSLGGPIAIFQNAGMAFKQGVIAYTSFLGIISIMLAFVNILPIPGLDGGHLLFFGFEAVMRRPLSLAMQLLIVRLGFIFLIVLILQATINDLMRIF